MTTQDLEFTVENGQLFLLQTRAGERSGLAAVRIAVELAREGRITKVQALERVQPEQMVELLFARLDRRVPLSVIGNGLATSPGAVSGRIALSSAAAVRLAESGDDIILLREETSPDDLEGMAVAAGILTARGGVTSHAAVVARGAWSPGREYCEKGLLSADPFVHLDTDGGGRLMRTACTLVELHKPGTSVVMYGEHGGDPQSIEFCQRLGLKYVSCSPFRVPVARLAAAQVALRERKADSGSQSRRSA